MSPIFQKYNYSVYNYTSVTKLNIDDLENEFLADPYHGSEIIFSNLFLDISKSNRKFDELLNKKLIRQKLSKQPHLFLFEN